MRLKITDPKHTVIWRNQIVRMVTDEDISGYADIESNKWYIKPHVMFHKLLGWKVRDEVRVYNGGVRLPMKSFISEDYSENVLQVKNTPEGFTIIKQPIGFQGNKLSEIPGLFYGEEGFIPLV